MNCLTCRDVCSCIVELRTLDRATTKMDSVNGKSFNKLNDGGAANRDVLLFDSEHRYLNHLYLWAHSGFELNSEMLLCAFILHFRCNLATQD